MPFPDEQYFFLCLEGTTCTFSGSFGAFCSSNSPSGILCCRNHRLCKEINQTLIFIYVSVSLESPPSKHCPFVEAFQPRGESNKYKQILWWPLQWIDGKMFMSRPQAWRLVFKRSHGYYFLVLSTLFSCQWLRLARRQRGSHLFSMLQHDGIIAAIGTFRNPSGSACRDRVFKWHSLLNCLGRLSNVLRSISSMARWSERVFRASVSNIPSKCSIALHGQYSMWRLCAALPSRGCAPPALQLGRGSPDAHVRLECSSKRFQVASGVNSQERASHKSRGGRHPQW